MPSVAEHKISLLNPLGSISVPPTEGPHLRRDMILDQTQLDHLEDQSNINRVCSIRVSVLVECLGSVFDV